MKRLLGCAVAAFVVVGQQASADIIFSESFTRANNDIVNNSWGEAGDGPTGISILNNQVHFGNTGAVLDLTHAITTTGYNSLSLAFDYAISAGVGGTLTALY